VPTDNVEVAGYFCHKRGSRPWGAAYRWRNKRKEVGRAEKTYQAKKSLNYIGSCADKRERGRER
jgi:hypothetical protein